MKRQTSQRLDSPLFFLVSWVPNSCLFSFGPAAALRLLRVAASRHPRLGVVILIAVLAGFSGCGYTVGNSFQTEIRSVSVPTFTSDTFRRGIEFQLTEAVQKKIQERTHFRLAKEPYADTRLKGNVVEIRKDVVGESAFDDPRELQLSLAVEVTWEDVRSGQILAQETIPIAPDVVHLISQSEFAPEVGQSLATGTQQAVDRMARQIVDMMETPW